MFKTLLLGFRGPGQVTDGPMLTMSTPKGAIRESSLSGQRSGLPAMKPLGYEIGR
jgi:hypothetical protein